MFSSAGYEFQSRHTIQLILVTTARSRIICSATCNEQPACHTFDYDSASGRCRLFEADQTVGSIIASTSLTSVVGNVLISQSQFDHTYNQSCEACQEDRYQYCSINGSTCQCRSHTFWNGSVCLLQLFENDTCSQADACRTDFNLICAIENGQFSVCTSGFTSLTSTMITTNHINIITATTTAAINAIATTITNTTATNISTGTNASTSIATTTTTTGTEITTAISISTETAASTSIATTTTTTGTEITTAINKITTAIATTDIEITTAIDKTTSAIATTHIEITTAINKITTAVTTASTIIQPNISTVAGFYNGSCPTSSANLTVLHTQGGIAVSKNGTLYVGDGASPYALLAFEPNNLTAKQIFTYSNWAAYLAIDPVTSSIYATVFNQNSVVIWPSNRTIPKIPSPNCSDVLHLYKPTGIFIDSLGNIYITSKWCNWVTKWNPNATNATLVAGSLTAASGSDSQHLNTPYGLFVDEIHSLLYVTDAVNNRVQRFALGNLTGVTVAGGNGVGTASNQLNYPSAIHISQRDNSYYICDYYNNRIQRWAIGATYGVTIAGSSTGVAGNALNLLNAPYDIWIDPNATYMLISDSSNCRVQKYLLY
ncbi:unnamed protein product [Adineta steineri]|uniref:Apple domain-containing protein n=1 Tax=Adineta steineri TaxID=433720 RepID=A0A815VPH5_9BILA|nr:unnamed protein product [Adineta steineri]CAF1531563.1 unnamed protein product [Adineta steineri]